MSVAVNETSESYPEETTKGPVVNRKEYRSLLKPQYVDGSLDFGIHASALQTLKEEGEFKEKHRKPPQETHGLFCSKVARSLCHGECHVFLQ